MIVALGSILTTLFRKQNCIFGTVTERSHVSLLQRYCLSTSTENHQPSAESYHTPILLNECCQYLDIKPGGIYIDCTLGGGGHTNEILSRGGKVIGLDQDMDAVKHSSNRLRSYIDNGQLEIIQTNFRRINSVVMESSQLYKNHLETMKLKNMGNDEFGVDGVLMDLGISSHQIDFRDRGFSFQGDGPLDMRMNRDEGGLTAHEIVNQYPVDDIANILYGMKVLYL